MLNSVSDNVQNSPLAPVLLFTENPLLALDIEQAIQSIGFKAWICGTDDVAEVDDVETEKVSAAIIDLDASDSRWPSCLGWLLQRNIRTIVVSNREDGPEDEGAQKLSFPNVIAWFDIPFNVDDMLPVLRAPVDGNNASVDGVPG